MADDEEKEKVYGKQSGDDEGDSEDDSDKDEEQESESEGEDDKEQSKKLIWTLHLYAFTFPDNPHKPEKILGVKIPFKMRRVQS